METRRWTNPSQPQTLYLAVVLFYINAVMSLIFGNAVSSVFGFIGVIAFIVGSVAAGLGIANEKKWGYILGVVTAAFQLVPFVLAIALDGVGVVFNLSYLIAVLFPIVLFALLVHPMSRDYQRIWFH
jgi:peptidoglycan/LPS O-acetylase OafA/YrhL